MQEHLCVLLLLKGSTASPLWSLPCLYPFTSILMFFIYFHPLETITFFLIALLGEMMHIFVLTIFLIMFLSQSLFHPVYLHISSLPLLVYSLTWSVTNPLFLCSVFSGRETEAWLLSLYMLCCFDGCMIWGIPCPLLQFHISNAIFGHQFVKNQNPDNHVNLEKRKHRDEWTCANKTLSQIKKKKNWHQTWLHKAEINAPESITEISFCCSV